jgi:hypothetical protein
MTDYGIHPIPWRDIVTYADIHDLTPANYHALRQVIREMDATYRKWQAAERERKTKQPPKPET